MLFCGLLNKTDISILNLVLRLSMLLSVDSRQSYAIDLERQQLVLHLDRKFLSVLNVQVDDVFAQLNSPTKKRKSKKPQKPTHDC